MTIQWTTPAGQLFTATEAVSITHSVAATNATSYSLISGQLPAGLSLSSDGVISGSASNVYVPTTSTFVIRAANASSIKDRTFSAVIYNNGGVNWLTTTTFLATGVKGEQYSYNHQYVDYQLDAIPVGDPSTAEITYKISSGQLPHGLKLSSTGTISGYLNAKLHVTTLTQLVGDPTIFNFTVDATDGYNTSSKSFSMLVIDPNIYRSDSTFLAFSNTGTTTTVISTIASGTTILSTSTNISPKVTPAVGQYVAVLGDTTYFYMNVGTTITNVSSSGTITLSTGTLNTINTGSVIYFYNYLSAFEAETILLDQTPVSAGYLQPAQWINGVNLGVVRANNNVDLDLSAYNPAPLVGTITYALVTGTTISTNLPEGLTLDPYLGHIYGFIPYQPVYTRQYQLTVNATNTEINPLSTVTSSLVTTNTFVLTVAGNVFSSIEWVSTSSLGSIEIGIVSDLYVLAKEISSDYAINYQLTSGSLPSGLTLERDGTISGRAVFGSTGTYTFTITASDIYVLSAVNRTFTLEVVNSTKVVPYTSIYVKPFLSSAQRQTYQDFINDQFVFDQSLIYRYFDPNFGVQPEMRLYLEYAIQELNLDQYAYALYQNFYRRKLYFGDVKYAVAADPNTGVTQYEVVYVEIVDPNIASNGTSVNPVYYSNDYQNIYYPSSVSNMRTQLETLVTNHEYVSVNSNGLPLFMRTIQPGQNNSTGYITVIPICYALPGNGANIVDRINISGFKFNQFSFEIDRIIVSSSLDNSADKYLIFERQHLSDAIAEDNKLFGPDDVEIDFGLSQGNISDPVINAEDGAVLTDEDGNILEY